ncbi:winged helix-turn-helix transcriptional regulator [Cohnella caldifontis]|uniref:winged helix-turn-helix transcriptional regulator n=1 Tax=Cohnella caldifontis TaxID=3027471 RepID=UPI0023ED3CCF|nr:helix-turn-helix domain-containing protein [Cohnella sp. YIM B05605]
MQKCPVEITVELIEGKWKTELLRHLLGGTKRFNELRRLMPEVTQRVMTNQLREMERDGLVERTVYAEIPPKVEYRLTELGRSLEPMLLEMLRWGEAYVRAAEAAGCDRSRNP